MTKTERQIHRQADMGLMAALMRARRRFGGGTLAFVDGDGRRLSYTDTVRGAFALGSALRRLTRPGEIVGIMLPTGVGAMVAFFALIATGRIPAMINFTAGARTIKAAFKVGRIETVLTAHTFLEIANLQALGEELGQDVRLIYLDELREKLTLRDRLTALVGSFLPRLVMTSVDPAGPGAVLFTSGTEGTPKGVVLSHRNILSNVFQIDAHIETEPGDVFFNPLPVFHSYGLTAGCLYPALSGKPAVLHPSPLQVKIIPKRIKENRATILFATDTFLQQYVRSSDDNDLTTLRFAVCGAERVRDETRAMARKRFAFEVLEGYGVTEAAPVLAANQPGDIQSGTVGRLLPAIEYRLEPVEGLEEGGCLFVRGPNVMSGYLSVENPGEVIMLDEGWHNTGDVVTIDAQGYVAIRDRIKRFAKIGGEMVSLSVVENCAQAIWPDDAHAAITLPDAHRGEQIILATTAAGADTARMRAWCVSHGVSALTVPRRVLIVDEVPVLGTGKTNYGVLKTLIAETLAEEDNAAKEGASEPPA